MTARRYSKNAIRIKSGTKNLFMISAPTANLLNLARFPPDFMPDIRVLCPYGACVQNAPGGNFLPIDQSRFQNAIVMLSC